jgi:hypothetical protein
VGVCSNKIFFDYPWLTTKLDTSQCTTESITAYRQGIFTYIFVKTATTGILYFQNGSLHCTNGIGLDCVTAYQLKDVVGSWTCSRIVTATDKDKDGVLSDTDPDDNNPCVPNAKASTCANNNKLFADFPWLSTKLDTTQCTTESITAYRQGIFTYIFVKSPTKGILYFQDGGLHCTNGIGLDCVTAYQLKDVVGTWTCSRIGTPTDKDKDGVLSDTDSDDNNPCVPNAKAGTCNNKLFSDYPWLTSKLDTAQCNPAESITAYRLGAFTYVFVKTATKGILYFQDGGLHCTNGIGLDCVAAYQLKDVVGTWTCSRIGTPTDKDKDGVLSDTDPDDNNPCVPNAKAGACTNKLFSDYPWLTTKLDTAQCSAAESITAYRLGVFTYIFVKTATKGILYFQDGGLHCTNGIGLDCVTAYQLKDVVGTWTCTKANSEASLKKAEESNFSTLAKTIEMQVFPNPSSGKVFIKLPNNTGKSLNVFSATGQLIQAINLNEHSSEQLMELDLTGKASGLYLIQWKDDKTVLTKRLIVN